MFRDYKVAHYGWNCESKRWFYFVDGSWIRPAPTFGQGNEHLEIWEQRKGKDVIRFIQRPISNVPDNIIYYP